MYVFFFKQKTAYEMRISDWSSDVCSSDLNSYQKHSEYIVQHSDLQGFSQTDKLILAALLRLHRGKFAATSTAGLPEEWREPVRRLAIMLRLAYLLHRSRQPGLRPPLQIEATRQRVQLGFRHAHWLERHPLTHADLQREVPYLSATPLRQIGRAHV